MNVYMRFEGIIHKPSFLFQPDIQNLSLASFDSIG